MVINGDKPVRGILLQIFYYKADLFHFHTRSLHPETGTITYFPVL